jgi:hypothetical protein
MKRIMGFVFLFLFVSMPLFAQTAKIIDLTGKVQAKAGPAAEWQKARVNMILGREAEVMTDRKSSCTLAFDEEMKNILTISENSHIRIDSLRPGQVFLPEGRVFSLIENLSKGEQFRIRTPTAIAGARGTGWETGSGGGSTSILCFDDTVHAQGLDEDGNVTDEADLGSGFGMDIGFGGALGEPFALSDADYERWSDFTDNVGNVTGNEPQGGFEPGGNNAGALEDLGEEQRQDFQSSTSETIRQEQEPQPEGEGEYQVKE